MEPYEHTPYTSQFRAEGRVWPPAFEPRHRQAILRKLASGETDPAAVAKSLGIAPEPVRAIIALLAAEALGEPTTDTPRKSADGA